MAKQKSATRRILTWAIGLIILLVVLGVVGRVTGLIGGGEATLSVEVEDAARRTITQVVTASGKVQPEVEVNISPDVSGEIISLYVEEGDDVQQGQPLVRIRPDFYRAQQEQAEAGVLQSKAALAQRQADLLQAQAEFNRTRELHEKGVVSESEFMSAQTTHEVAKSSLQAAEYAVQSAEARLREADEQLGKTTIYAPMTGTISQLNVELGERVVGTSQMAGTEMMRVARLDQMEIEVDVNENDIVNVSIGDTAAVEIDSYPERIFNGVVTEIANSARISGAGSQEQVTNFPVKIRIVGTRGAETGTSAVADAELPLDVRMSVLRPGMSGTVDVFTETVGQAVAIPIQAVTMRDVSQFNRDDSTGTPAPADLKEDLRKVVFIVEDGKVAYREVETGISDDTHIVVRSGLAGGESVITGPYRLVSRTLEPGLAVTVSTPGSGAPPFAAR